MSESSAWDKPFCVGGRVTEACEQSHRTKMEFHRDDKPTGSKYGVGTNWYTRKNRLRTSSKKRRCIQTTGYHFEKTDDPEQSRKASEANENG